MESISRISLASAKMAGFRKLKDNGKRRNPNEPPIQWVSPRSKRLSKTQVAFVGKKKDGMPCHGMSLLVARRTWVAVGGTVSDKNGTGEEVYRHRAVLKWIVVNKRRKDAPRELTVALIRIWRSRPHLNAAG